MKCKYKIGTKCLLLTECLNQKGIYPPKGFCEEKCKADDKEHQLLVLKSFGIILPESSKDIDLLEWVKKCIENKTIRNKANEKHEQRTIRKKEKQEEKEKKLLERAKKAGLPNAATQIKLLGNHSRQVISHYIHTRELYVSDEVFEKRLAICRECPTNKMVVVDGIMRCKMCGCGMDKSPFAMLNKGKGKAWYVVLDCEDGNFDDIESETAVSPDVATNNGTDGSMTAGVTD